MTSKPNNPLNSPNNAGKPSRPQTDLVQLLLCEIVRVKELIAFNNAVPNGAGKLGASILTELVIEAYNSLINYDETLMKKYYDLLQNCD